MRYGKLLWLVAPLMAVSACTDDDGVTVQPPPGPAALVRFINAVPDQPVVDLRFVDKVENLPMLQGVPFAGGSGMYQRVTPGERATRVFPNSPDVNVTKTRLIDTKLNLVAQSRYTLLLTGMVGDGTHSLEVLQDPAVINRAPAGQISIQLLHAAVGVGEVDVYLVPVATDTTSTPANFVDAAVAKISNVGYLERVEYMNVPVRPAQNPDMTNLSLYRFVVTAAGSTVPLFAATPNQPGAMPPADATYGPQPGMTVEGSVMTAVLFGGDSPTVTVFPDRTLDPTS